METNDNFYISLKKRSMITSDPALTWEEMNENLQKIEDRINELKNKKIETTEKAAPSGVATLDENARLQEFLLPEIIDGGNF